MSTHSGFAHARAAERRDGETYGRGVGTLILPHGTHIAVSQEEPSLPLNVVLAREVLAQYEEMKK